ncbi:MAG TPA: TIGR03086 family metal-binding protein [Aquihabitans sp.]|nr:TIGR03086 family metal-binding protein [Aquihabitans sp.]
MTTRHGSAVVTLPSATEILIERSFEAPRWLVWEAMTQPRHLLRWWGPSWCPMVACEVDLRPGGSWRYVSQMDDGTELAWHGTYRRIEPAELLESTEVFEGVPDAESVNTVTFEESDGVTTVRTLVRHSSQANRDGHVESGMEAGMQETFDRLDAILDAADAPAERFRRIAGRFSDRVAEVPADAWDRPAPPAGWVARDVVRHLVEWVPAVIGRSGIGFAPGPSVDDDPQGAWTALADALQAALDDPEVAARTYDVGPPGEMTVEASIGMIVTGDVLVHTWDLARATGLDESLDPILTAEMLVGMAPMDEVLRQSGHYGPKVELPDGASVQDQLIAFTGRDPRR